MRHAPFLSASSFSGNNLIMSSGLQLTELSSNDFPVTVWLLHNVSFDRPSLFICLSPIFVLCTDLNFFLLKALVSLLSWIRLRTPVLSSWIERLIMLVSSLPSYLLRCESCLQVQLSDLSTKAEDNLNFLLSRLNFSPAWLPKHISSLFLGF